MTAPESNKIRIGDDNDLVFDRVRDSQGNSNFQKKFTPDNKVQLLLIPKNNTEELAKERPVVKKNTLSEKTVQISSKSYNSPR